MKTKQLVLGFFAIMLALTSCKKEYENLADGLYAEITTSKGVILLELFPEKAPVTVANFITLAEGTNTFVSADLKGKKLFDGLKFHRVIADFMIQGGDPLGNGSGDAGYKFKDEFTDLKFDVPGVLAMANSGPGTNSSQFFITHVATPHLDGKHTIYGQVIEKGMEVVNAIQQDDLINSIKIIRKGEKAKQFNAVKIFSDYFSVEGENQKKMKTEADALAKENVLKYGAVIDKKLAFFEVTKASSTKSSTGLQYKIISKGNGKKLADGTQVKVKYSGFLEDGTLFDTSEATVAREFGKVDENRAAQGGYQTIPYSIGAKEGMIPGFIEGLSKINVGDKIVIFIPSELGYGAQGAGGIIPPNANIIFEVEMLK